MHPGVDGVPSVNNLWTRLNVRVLTVRTRWGTIRMDGFNINVENGRRRFSPVCTGTTRGSYLCVEQFNRWFFENVSFRCKNKWQSNRLYQISRWHCDVNKDSGKTHDNYWLHLMKYQVDEDKYNKAYNYIIKRSIRYKSINVQEEH